MSRKIIEVTVSPKGEVTVQTKGYVGTACQQATKDLQQALGVTTSDNKTPDFYAVTEIQQTVQQ